MSVSSAGGQGRPRSGSYSCTALAFSGRVPLSAGGFRYRPVFFCFRRTDEGFAASSRHPCRSVALPGDHPALDDPRGRDVVRPGSGRAGKRARFPTASRRRSGCPAPSSRVPSDCTTRPSSGETSWAPSSSSPRKGKIVLHEAVGMRDKERGLPMERNSMFRMASNTKPVVATAIAQLVEEGKLSYDDLVREYIPEWDNYRAGFITVGHLLAHSSGLRIPTLFLQPLGENPTLQSESAPLRRDRSGGDAGRNVFLQQSGVQHPRARSWRSPPASCWRTGSWRRSTDRSGWRTATIITPRTTWAERWIAWAPSTTSADPTGTGLPAARPEARWPFPSRALRAA